MAPELLRHGLDELASLGPDVVRYTVHWDQVARKRPRNRATRTTLRIAGVKSTRSCAGSAATASPRSSPLYGTPSWANEGPRRQLGPVVGQGVRRLRVRGGPQVLVDSRLDHLERAEPTAFLQSDGRRDLRRDVAQSCLRRASCSHPRREGRGRRYGAERRAQPVSHRCRGSARWKVAREARRIRAQPVSGQAAERDALGPEVRELPDDHDGRPRERLEREVARAFGHKPIWLTEYGYQTNPPDIFLGVSPEKQAAYVSSAALRVFRAALRRDADLPSWCRTTLSLPAGRGGFLT